MSPLPGTYFIRIGDESIETALKRYDQLVFESGKVWIKGYKNIHEANLAFDRCIERANEKSFKAELLDSDLNVISGFSFRVFKP